MKCAGICSNHAVKKLRPGQSGRYESGQKRCSFCEIYIVWEGQRCPCCSTALRAKPHNSRYRTKILSLSK